MSREFYAHTVAGQGPGSWQTLEDHLEGVAGLASRFAAAFGSADWGRLAGLWHDLGKLQADFQTRLRGESVRVEHSGAGAALSEARFKQAGVPLAFAICGHHGGLPNHTSSVGGGPSPLRERLAENRSTLEAIQTSIPPAILEQDPPELPAFVRIDGAMDAAERARAARSAEFWTRFLFSALVDADWLDTEAFLEPARAAGRGRGASFAELKERLDAHMAGLTAGAVATPVNRARADILAACREAASHNPGLFSLTAPTGGGKTLSAMAFALDHAVRHDLRRVIVVVPYTSIIEQNAAAYRHALGVESVLEHHSNLDPEKFSEMHGEEITRKHELAAENWDLPVIVTTSVQFFESLFSNKRSRCRKLHNVARSVIILDEVQSLPPEFLLAILDALRELPAHYGCSVVLSTATQPALGKREQLPAGLEGVREILPDAPQLAAQLRRVEYEWPEPETPAVEWPDLADELAEHEQVLAVVHKRDDARALARLLEERVPGETVYHLSALMCAKHRLACIETVRDALRRGEPCRLISTQLIEAGVDLDFPVVYRALGGLDSIVQAGGRCKPRRAAGARAGGGVQGADAPASGNAFPGHAGDGGHARPHRRDGYGEPGGV